MDCSSCHTAIPDGGKFCPSCGKVVQPKLPPACANCGQTLDPGQQYCTVCGTPAGSLAGPPPAPAAAPTTHATADALYPTSYPNPPSAVSVPERPASDGRPAVAVAPAGRPAGKGHSAGFWAPFAVLLLLSVFVFWAGNSSPQGWAILILSYIALFASRRRISSTGILTGLLIWTVLLVILFFVLIATSTPRIG